MILFFLFRCEKSRPSAKGRCVRFFTANSGGKLYAGANSEAQRNLEYTTDETPRP